MKIPQVDAADLALFARITYELSDYGDLSAGDKAMCEATVLAAEHYCSGQTGLACARDGEADEEPNGDLRYAVLTVGAEMLDNRQMTAQYSTQNPAVTQILAMHSTNLLPSAEEE